MPSTSRFGSKAPVECPLRGSGQWRRSPGVARRRSNGKYRDTTARIENCRRFCNQDGRLVCEAEADVATGWHGSFRNTCINERIDKKGHLKADCRRENGSYRKAELGPGNCPSRRAGNDDGRLVCESSGFGGSGGSTGSSVRWHGSFKGSCRDVSMDSAGNLRASCQKVNGRWERAYLAERSCPSHRAGNSDGRLVCEQ